MSKEILQYTNKLGATVEVVKDGELINIMAPSPFTGVTATVTIEYNYEQFIEDIAKWQAGTVIQDVFTTLPAELREFIMTGIPGDEWNVFVVL